MGTPSGRRVAGVRSSVGARRPCPYPEPRSSSAGEVRAAADTARRTAFKGASCQLPRELEVLTRAATRRTNQAIARALFLSPWTVRSNIEHLLRKTGPSPAPRPPSGGPGRAAAADAGPPGVLRGAVSRPCGSAEGPLGLPFG
ncbi:response regulator transcription factor [Streptomyces griseorubiginosus]|uniref:response regulator transcription factor n=1 Tax=Streptomyces griseorubiginosus TaxID=67304 RepID=UPI003661CC39